MTVLGNKFLTKIGAFLVRALEREDSRYTPYTPFDIATLRRVLRPGDVILIEGNQRISSIIKYLTQSTWSHAALYIGAHQDLTERMKSADTPSQENPTDPTSTDNAPNAPPEDTLWLIEVLMADGCICVPLSKYATYNIRICRPVGLSNDDIDTIVDFMIGKIGTHYDLKNIIDMLRYFIRLPLPAAYRRRAIAFGAGDPTRAICSTLIAQAFQRVRYPVLPIIENRDDYSSIVKSSYSRPEIMHIRHHSLYAPRDFDLSPYFRVVKPTLETGFDYKTLQWSDQGLLNVDP